MERASTDGDSVVDDAWLTASSTSANRAPASQRIAVGDHSALNCRSVPYRGH